MSTLKENNINSKNLVIHANVPALIIGIGNCGRADDGIGWAFLDTIRGSYYNVKIEYRYQLQVEDVELISQYPSVMLVDATKDDSIHDFELTEVFPSPDVSFTSHALDPRAIAHLVHQLYGSYPDIHLLAIRGNDWDLREGLSEYAKKNLSNAVDFFRKTYPLRNGVN